jgi:[glutamine synthetase] adenylyltransferase / [glutamine synthetase]-adenylyl-L-tyrosine phosphorylase
MQPTEQEHCMAARQKAEKSAALALEPAIAWEDPQIALAALNKKEASRYRGELVKVAEAAGFAELAGDLRVRDDFSGFLAAAFTLSPFLRDLVIARPGRLASILAEEPETARARLLASTRVIGGQGETQAELMASLRHARAEMALLCGLADLGGWWQPEEVTHTLTDFADAAIGAALDYLLVRVHETGKIELADPGEPSRQSGLFVLGMGKYGAHELNYSSDVDLILFFDPSLGRLNTDDPVSLFSRLGRDLIKVLQERTGDGYVFRVDMRLRPDPGSTPLALPVGAALNYYEAHGQNWERAAMIKARAVAGDIDTGCKFLAELRPFIWRKYLDYAAISEVHSIKRQINVHRGHEEIAVAGHNIKLGRGGIREIEFFAQTQQLIAGGRLPALRCLRTIEALAALQRGGWIDASARDELSEAYWYLRNVEHRIQMVADEQSHTLPGDEAGLRRIAIMMGESSVKQFGKTLTGKLRTVEKHYDSLFETSPELSAAKGNLVFTGDDDDPSTLEALSEFGFGNPSQVVRIVRGWHFGRFPAVRSAQARELLTELTPGLLKSISATGDPDHTLAAFDRFLSGLPGGIQLFALLKSNPGLRHQLLLILGSAPRLAETITRKPHVFDGMLEPAFFGKVPDRAALAERLETALAPAADYESVLDMARIFAAEQRFLIGVRLLNGTLSTKQAGKSFANLAEILIQAMLDRVTAEFEKRYGKVQGAACCILAMGRLGSRELTSGSDLDLILLYDHDDDVEYSDGSKPLAASQYFIRLTQRLIAAMSAPTAEGRLYELDFRLRPSGNAGPLATSVVSFLKYQEFDAWTWERQALLRARTVAGDGKLRARVDDHITRLLAMPIDPKKLTRDIGEMRALIDREKPAENPFDVKNARGGLIDVEFIAQWATLRAGVDASAPRATSIIGMIECADPAILPFEIRETLRNALVDYNRVSQLVRLCINGVYDPETSPKGLGEILCHAFDLPQIGTVENHLVERQTEVRKLFDRLIH